LNALLPPSGTNLNLILFKFFTFCAVVKTLFLKFPNEQSRTEDGKEVKGVGVRG
jgi:hypothetical protein